VDTLKFILTDEQKAWLRRRSADYERDWLAFEAAYAGLVEGREGQWVAWYHGEAAFADTLDRAVAAAQERGWDLGAVILRCLRTERPLVAL
jgi:hypothetical protein